MTTTAALRKATLLIHIANLRATLDKLEAADAYAEDIETIRSRILSEMLAVYESI